MTVGELARITQWSVVGDDSLPLSGIAYAANATVGDLALIERDSDLEQTPACALLTHPREVGVQVTALYTAEPIAVAAIRAAWALIEHKDLEDWSADADLLPVGSAFVAPDAQLGDGVRLGPGATVERQAKVGDGVIIEAGAHIKAGSVVGKGSIISHGAVIGADAFFAPEEWIGGARRFVGIGRALVGEGVNIGSNTVVQRGAFACTKIGNNSIIGENCVIGHDAWLGEGVIVLAQSGIEARAWLGDHSVLLGRASVNAGVHVGRASKIMALSCATKDVPDETVIFGQFGREMKGELRYHARLRRLAEQNKATQSWEWSR